MNDNKKEQNDLKDDSRWWVAPLAVFFRLSGLVAGPLLFSLFLGKLLDRRYGTTPWIFLSLTAIAFIFSMFIIIKKANDEIDKINK